MLIFCFLFPLWGVGGFSSFAQNTDYYKFIITPTDTCHAINGNILEVKDKYYMDSHIFSSGFFLADTAPIVVFDKDLNITREIFLEEQDISLAGLFYKNNYFYVFGYPYGQRKSNPLLWNIIYFAKYDENFNLVQPICSCAVDSIGMIEDILMTKNNEFIILFGAIMYPGKSRLLQINDTGKVLLDLSLPDGWEGQMVETDSNYIVNYWNNPYVRTFRKDSLEQYQWHLVEQLEENFIDSSGQVIGNEFYNAPAISVGNQLIRANQFHTPRCDNDYFYPEQRSILFFNQDLKIEHRLRLGDSCLQNVNRVSSAESMDYINPDSIYYAYTTDNKSGNSTISIACFSSKGELHFDHTLDLYDHPGTMFISSCKAMSDGGVLVLGDYEDFGNYANSRGFLLYFHPNKDVSGVKEYAANAERQIFPNPARSQFTVTNTQNASLQLYNTVGQEVLHTQSTEENTIINVSTLPQGLYMLKVVKDGAVRMYKVVVSR